MWLLYIFLQREELVNDCQKRNNLISQGKDSLPQGKLSSQSLGTVALQTQAAARTILQINPRQGNYQSCFFFPPFQWIFFLWFYWSRHICVIFLLSKWWMHLYNAYQRRFQLIYMTCMQFYCTYKSICVMIFPSFCWGWRWGVTYFSRNHVEILIVEGKRVLA